MTLLPRRRSVLVLVLHFIFSLLSYAVIESHPLCSREQVMNGNWRPLRLDKAPVIIKDYEPCTHKPLVNQTFYDTWHWIPKDSEEKSHGDGTKCEFTRWSNDQFCSLFKNDTILFMGDSMSREHFNSLWALLKGDSKLIQPQQVLPLNHTFACPKDELPLIRDGGVHHNYYHVGFSTCNDTTQIWFTRQNRLCNVPDALFTPPLDHPNFFPTVVIMNRGTWFVSDELLLENLELNFEYIRRWLDTCKSRNHHCHFFWRTSVPGHPFCYFHNITDVFNFSEPNNDLERVESYIQSVHTTGGFFLDGWKHLRRQNYLVLDLLRTSGTPHTIIDAYEINTRRPDGHRDQINDCLHNCLQSGKIDVYNQLLLHYVRRRKR